jgi:hypothetical protein
VQNLNFINLKFINLNLFIVFNSIFQISMYVEIQLELKSVMVVC